MGEWFYLLFQIGVLFFQFCGIENSAFFSHRNKQKLVEFILRKKNSKIFPIFYWKKPQKFWGKEH
jgi:hypothetical protein